MALVNPLLATVFVAVLLWPQLAGPPSGGRAIGIGVLVAVARAAWMGQVLFREHDHHCKVHAAVARDEEELRALDEVGKR